MTAGPTDAASHEGAGSKGHLAELEGWRALAALGVLLTHVGFLSGATGRHILPGFLARADIGVAIFFVLSGFLLYRPWARRSLVNGPPIDSRSYAVRRFARLVPAWLLVLVGTLLLVPESRDAGATPWIANLLQVQSLRLEWDLPGLAQLWSLSTEVMFYLVLPPLAMLLARLLPTPPGSVFLDGTDITTLEPVKAGDYVMLGVCDNGTGMAPKILAKAFDPFFTTKFAGRGLGLVALRRRAHTLGSLLRQGGSDRAVQTRQGRDGDARAESKLAGLFLPRIGQR